MFLGQYEHSVDEKGRMTIPAKFREQLDGGAFVTQGFDRNLMVLTKETFDRLYNRVNQMSMTDPTVRQLRRLIFSNASQVEIDKSGRLLFPQFLRDTASLQGTTMIVGVGEYFEIWSPELWTNQLDQIKDADSERFATLDLSLR